MKRRNAECGKMRRPIKRNKITEGIYGSTLLYLKFLLLWAMVILADFILEFRFEFLWPFWMLLRSVYDSFKYQGLAFSVFFVCIAVTSDMICFFFIPVQWVFFAASTYVWVQYVWYTDKGVCLPTLILCTVFVYVEAGVRLRDLRHVPAHLDLCRPFAAHCIGYPVVTLGFGLKSFVGHRMRRRRQREVARENTFYMQLLQQALPPHQQPAIKEPEKGVALTIEKTSEVHLPEKHMNGNVIHMSSSKNHSKKSDAKSNQQQSDKNMSSSHQNHTSPSGTLQMANHKDSSIESGLSEGSVGTLASKSSQNHTAVTANHREKEKDKEKDSSKIYTQANQNKHTHSNGVIGHQQEKVALAWQHGSGNTGEKQKEGDPVQIFQVSHADIEMYTDKTAKGSKSSSKWEKKENVNSIREEKRKNKNKDKEANRERELNKEKDSNKDKESLKEKDSQKEKESHKDKESYKEKNSLKEKESHRENEKNSVREKDFHKDKDSHRDRDSLRESESQREKDSHKEKDSYKEKDSEKEKYTQKDSRDREINKDGDTNREKELHKEKDSKKERESYKEKDSAKERESKDFYKDKENDFYQKHSEQKESSLQREQLRSARAEAAQLRGQLEQLSLRLGAARAAERAAAAGAERRVAEERRRTEGCRQRRAVLEQEAAGLRGQLTQTRDRLQRVERDLQEAEQQVSNLETKSRENGPEAWHAALSALRERAQHLERSLSAETRIKLDLFSAVGEAKRQLGLREGVIRAQEKEIDELKGKIAQMLAIMPSEPFTSSPGGVSKLRAADCSFPPLLSHHHHLPSPLQTSHQALHQVSHQASHQTLHQTLHQPLHQALHQGPRQPPAPAVSPSSLDPNATAYTPKGGMVPCGPSSDV